MRKALTTVAFLMALIAAADTTSDAIVRAFPTETIIGARIDAAQLRQLNVYHSTLADPTTKPGLMITQIKAWLGVDINAIDTIWAAVEPGNKAAFVLEGTFDVNGIRTALTRIPTAEMLDRPYVAVAAKLPEEKKPGQYNTLALLGPKLGVFGNPDVADKILAAYVKPDAQRAQANMRSFGPLTKSPSAVHAIVLELPDSKPDQQPWLKYLSYAQITADIEEDLLITFGIGLTDSDMLADLKLLAQGFFGIYNRLDDATRGGNEIVNLLLQNAEADVAEQQLVLQSKIDMTTVEQLIQQKLGVAAPQ